MSGSVSITCPGVHTVRRGPSPFCLVVPHPKGWSSDHSQVLGVRAPGRGKGEERASARRVLWRPHTAAVSVPAVTWPRLVAGRGLCGLRLAAVCAGEAPGSGGEPGAEQGGAVCLSLCCDRLSIPQRLLTCLGAAKKPGDVAGRGAVGCETGTSPGGRAAVAHARCSHTFAPLPPRQGVRQGAAERVGGLTMGGAGARSGSWAPGPRREGQDSGSRPLGTRSTPAFSDGECGLSPSQLGLVICTLPGSWAGPAGVAGPVWGGGCSQLCLASLQPLWALDPDGSFCVLDGPSWACLPPTLVGTLLPLVLSLVTCDPKLPPCSLAQLSHPGSWPT